MTRTLFLLRAFSIDLDLLTPSNYNSPITAALNLVMLEYDDSDFFIGDFKLPDFILIGLFPESSSFKVYIDYLFDKFLSSSLCFCTW